MEYRRASVVVVGAGAVGLAVALELRRAGVEDVLVLDRNPSPGLGSTSRANGGVRAQFTTPINIEFSRFTIERLVELDRTTGGLVGLRQVGYLFLTGTGPGAAALRRAFDLQTSLGVGVEWLGPDEVLGIAPFVKVDGLRAATFCATDGIIDPHGVVSALWNEGRRIGAEYIFDTEIRAIDVASGRTILRTAGMDVEPDHVVNAAGPLARDLAAMAGVDLPVIPYRRNLACTEPVSGFPDLIPMCVDVDTGVLIRREAGGFLVAYSDPEDPPSVDTTFDPAFLDAVAQRVGNRFPFLETVPINPRKCWSGLYPETPDHHAIIDAPAEAPWFVQCAGFGGHGIMHSLAAGRAVAELIGDGRCTSFDLRPLRLDRFGDPDTVVETAVL